MKTVILPCLLQAGTGPFVPIENWEITRVEQRGTDCSWTDQGNATLTVACYPEKFTTRVIIQNNNVYGETSIPEGCHSPNVIDVIDTGDTINAIK